ncbi:hypothetical protein PUNSTDRAFT_133394 [Punctularia strigosozonata HHB-11173 SS5]|uniref:uncharacterized protein n=1 Tax=Punctularia strigosozonata (strain HHB-11173) TaxID=741275 RepID=UPI000441737F|nr:uncharacterized protein PUNSTDRAFT_133394 [Punctularia strigosozonata HHB-11173 SS5]EIN09612.1 hypothetical protein PUNSTDRAFT_133394 [Punctularia strigosozonata HHB-11173 SS5]
MSAPLGRVLRSSSTMKSPRAEPSPVKSTRFGKQAAAVKTPVARKELPATGKQEWFTVEAEMLCDDGPITPLTEDEVQDDEDVTGCGSPRKDAEVSHMPGKRKRIEVNEGEMPVEYDFGNLTQKARRELILQLLREDGEEKTLLDQWYEILSDKDVLGSVVQESKTRAAVDGYRGSGSDTIGVSRRDVSASRSQDCEVWNAYNACGLLDPDLESTVHDLPPLVLHEYHFDASADPGLTLYSTFYCWNLPEEAMREFKRIVTSAGTVACGNPARMDPSLYGLVTVAGSQYIGYDTDKASVFVNVGSVRSSYLTGDGKELANTSKNMHGITITALAYEFNRQVSFMLMITGDDDGNVRLPYNMGQLEFNSRPGLPNWSDSKEKAPLVKGTRNAPVPAPERLMQNRTSLGYGEPVPVYDGRVMKKIVIDGDRSFNPARLPPFRGDVDVNMLVLVGYAINRYARAGAVEGVTKSDRADIRLNFNLLYVVVLADNDGVELEL